MSKLTFNGRVTYISEVTNGTSSAGKEWSKFFIIAEDNEQYANKVKIECLNKKDTFLIGQYYDFELSANVNEFKGNHYGSLNLWKATAVSNNF